jgi:hypothetical protein
MANGQVPEGYEIHHQDFNNKNYSLDNLIALPRKEHRLIHDARRKTNPARKEKIMDNERLRINPLAPV